MKFIKYIIAYSFSFICFADLHSAESIIPLIENQGINMFIQSKYQAAYWPLSQFYEMQQKNHCGVASAVMVLNALQIPRPQIWAGSTCAVFTQDNFFSSGVLELITKKDVEEKGMSLATLALALGTWDVDVKTVYADALTEDSFRELLKNYLTETDRFVIANFHSYVVYHEGGGHFSPIAAYDQETDSVLILDVFRCRASGTWVKLSQLLVAMHPLNNSTVRGVLLVHRP